MAKRDLVGVVEAAYDLTGGDRDWLRGIVTAAAPLLDRGTGVTAFSFDFSGRAATPLVGGPVTTGEDGSVPGTVEALSTAPAGALTHVFRAAPGLYSAADRLRREDRPSFTARVAEIGRKHNLPEHAGSELLIASEPSGAGVGMVAMCRNMPEVGERERALWTPVAVHIATALRLRRALRGGFQEEAVLEADGRCAHAESPAQSRTARNTLRDAVRMIDRARGRARREDQQEALAIWKGLCSGRWSLIDKFDSDGRRYVVAFRNDPSVQDPRALTSRERQVAAYAALGHTNKLIAYALGLSISTVGWHLSRAMHKLGLESRAELVRQFAVFGGSPAGPA